MNHYIYAQILNMQAMAKTFGQSCELAATKDDGKISKDEAKQLKRIKAAVEMFCKELDKVKAYAEDTASTISSLVAPDLISSTILSASRLLPCCSAGISPPSSNVSEKLIPSCR